MKKDRLRYLFGKLILYAPPTGRRFLIITLGLSLGGSTGAAMNPARDLGPRVMHFLLPIPGKRDTNWRYTYVLFCVMNKHAIKYPSLLFNHHFFKQNGLTGVFDIFGDSPYQVIQAIYPNQFQPWEFSTVLMNFWKNKENVMLAMEWFLFQKIRFSSYQEALQRLSQKHFTIYRMTGLYQMVLDHRLYKVKQ